MTPAHHLYPDVTLAAIAAELEREAGDRVAVHAGMVAKGRMTAEEVERQRAVLAAIAADLPRMAPRPSPDAPHPYALPSAHAVPWSERHAALRRELALRARHYPRWIEDPQHRLTADQARRQVRCLEALLAIYDDGFDWRASNGAAPCFAKTEHRTREEDQALAEWCEHQAQVEAERRPPEQKELSL